MTVGDDEDGSPDNNKCAHIFFVFTSLHLVVLFTSDDMDDMDDEFQRSFPNEEERRRYAHIHAEQKRRNNIKQAFLDLKDVVRSPAPLLLLVLTASRSCPTTRTSRTFQKQ